MKIQMVYQERSNEGFFVSSSPNVRMCEVVGSCVKPSKIPPWLCFSTCQGESLTKQWTYGPT